MYLKESALGCGFIGNVQELPIFLLIDLCFLEVMHQFSKTVAGLENLACLSLVSLYLFHFFAL